MLCKSWQLIQVQLQSFLKMKRHETVKTKVLGFSFYNECLLSCAGSGVDRS